MIITMSTGVVSEGRRDDVDDSYDFGCIDICDVADDGKVDVCSCL